MPKLFPRKFTSIIGAAAFGLAMMGMAGTAEALLINNGDTTIDDARADVFDYIERFYNRRRRDGYLGQISPAEFKERTLGLDSTVR